MTARNEPQPLGTPTWIDLTARDVDALRASLTSIFGWDAPAGDPAYGGYTIAHVGAERACGLAPSMNADGSPRPIDADYLTVYLATDDVDATASRVVAAGGRVNLGPMDVPGTGRMAIVADRAGNPFGLWQAESVTGFQRVYEPGFPCWFELSTPDPQSAASFYGDVFGLTFEPAVVDSTDWLNGENFGITRGEDGWTCFVHVGTDARDANAAADRVEAAGGTVQQAPRDFEFGRFGLVTLPGGAPIGLFAGGAQA